MNSTPDRLADAVADAIADGWRVDWAHLDARSLPRDVRQHLDHLRTIEQRAQSQAAAHDVSQHAGRAPLWIAGIVAICVGRLMASVIGFAVGTGASVSTNAPLPPWTYLVLALSLGAAGTFLLARNRTDIRVSLLAALFLIAGCAYTEVSFAQFVDVVPSWLRPWAETAGRLKPQALLPVCMWAFVRAFPAVPAHVTPQRVARVLVRVSAIASTMLFVANALPLSGPGAALVAGLSVTDPRGAFVFLVYGLTLLSLPTMVWKTAYAREDERRRTAIFFGGLVTGIAPVVVMAVAVSVSTRADQFVSEHLTALVALVNLFLLSTPLPTGYAVLVHRVLEVRAIAGRTLQYLLARSSLALLVVAPLVAAVALAYQHRTRTVAELLDAGAIRVLLAVAIAGLGALALRRRLLGVVERAFFRSGTDFQAILERFSHVSRQARSRLDIEQCLVGCGTSAFNAERTVVLWSRGHELDFVAAPGTARALPHTSVLVGALEHVAPVLICDLEHLTSSTRLLPHEDRDWLIDHDVQIVGGIVDASGAVTGIIGFGRKRSGLPYTPADRAFLSALVAAASTIVESRFHAAQDTRTSNGAEPTLNDAPAQECASCGRVFPADAITCADGCAGALHRAAVPWFALGKFQMDARLGAGGMGIVYRARDVSLDRVVAIKTLPHISPEGARQLRNEAKAMATVTHPNLALVYGVDMWRGTPLLVVEYLGGGTLADRIRRGPLALGDVVRLGVVLADVLCELHRRGLVHRDIKPSNIGFDALDVPKVLDFGLSYMLGATTPRPDAEASPGVVLSPTPYLSSATSAWACGTPLYVAPEVLNGAAPSPQLDLWSASVVLYEAASGRNPFAGGSARDVVERIVSGRVADIRAFAPECPQPVAQFFHDALAADRRQRPTDARQLRTRLDALAALVRP